MAKTTKQVQDIAVIQHTDGRQWLRLNGLVVFSSNIPRDTTHMAKATFRRFGSTIADAARTINAAPVITMTHKLFVQPYQYQIHW